MMQTLCGLFLERCGHEKAGDRDAVIYDDGRSETVRRTSYKELEQWADQITGVLRRVGVCEEVVGLLVPPGLSLPATLIGVMQVPAAFCPLDHRLPTNLLTQLISRLSLTTMLVGSSVLPVVKDKLLDCTVSTTEIPGLDLHVVVLKEVTHTRWRHRLAYVVTTSGTTGVPKLVRVPHDCIVPNITHIRDLYQLREEDLVFQASPLTFDPAIVEIFTTLSAGATLLMVPEMVKMAPSVLNSVLVERNKVTVIQATPALLHTLGSERIRRGLLSCHSFLRVLALGGEAFPAPSLLNSWRGSSNQTSLLNLYGITEVSSWASYHQLTAADLGDSCRGTVPLGLPLAATRLELRDSMGLPVTGPGQGELFIGGSDRLCVLNDEDVVTPGTMRASGDLVERDVNNRLWYLGRLDSHVKRHGKRVNLAELEKVAELSGYVEQAVANLWNTQLYLAIKPCPSASKGPLLPWLHLQTGVVERMKSYLKDNLPSHYLPDCIQPLTSLPLTRHGKVDREKLQGLVAIATRKNYADPSTWSEPAVRELVLSAWKESLGLEKLCDTDCSATFWELGGDSLAAVRLADQLEVRIGTPLPLVLDKVMTGSLRDVGDYVVASTRRWMTDTNPAQDASGSTVLPAADADVEKLEISNAAATIGEMNYKHSLPTPAESSTEDSKPTDDTQLRSYKRPMETRDDAYSRGCKLVKLNPHSAGACVNPHSAGAYGAMCKETTVTKISIQKCSRRTVVTSITDGSGPTLDCEPTAELLCRSDSQQPQISTAPGDVDSLQHGPLLLELLWKHDTKRCVDASPLVVTCCSQDKVFIGSHSHLFAAVSMDTGDLLWQRVLGDRIESSASLSLCGMFVVVGCYDGLVYVMNQETGDVVWTVTTRGQVKSSPCVDCQTGLVYIGSHDKHVYCLDVQTQEVVWKKSMDGSSVFGAPCVSTCPHLVFAVTLGGSLAALKPESGAVVWQVSCGKPLFSSPAPSPLGVVVGCVDGKLLGFSYQGIKLWEFETAAPVFSSPCVWSCDVCAVTIATEQAIPVTSPSTTPCCCPEVAMETIRQEAEHQRGCVLFGSHDSFVYCLNSYGQLRWKYKMSSAVYSSPFVFRWPSTKLCLSSACEQNKTVAMEIHEQQDNIIKSSPNELSLTEIGKIPEMGKTLLASLTDADESIVGSADSTMEKCEMCPPEGSTCQCLVAVCSTDGCCCILRLTDGTLVGQQTFQGELFSSPVVLNNTLVVGCRDNYLYCLKLQHKNLA